MTRPFIATLSPFPFSLSLQSDLYTAAMTRMKLYQRSRWNTLAVKRRLKEGVSVEDLDVGPRRARVGTGPEAWELQEDGWDKEVETRVGKRHEVTRALERTPEIHHRVYAAYDALATLLSSDTYFFHAKRYVLCFEKGDGILICRE